MASDHIILPLVSEPGVSRDSTNFDTHQYTDAQWCRFYNNRPRKIGGYKLISPGGSHITRSMLAVPSSQPNSLIQIYMGREDGIFMVFQTIDGDLSTEYNMTPEHYAPSDKNVWSFETIMGYLPQDKVPNPTIIEKPHSYILATLQTANESLHNVYYALINELNPPKFKPFLFTNDFGTSPPTTKLKASSGIIPAGPYLMVYNVDGMVQWSGLNNQTGQSVLSFFPSGATESPCNAPIVTAQSVRGGGTTSILLWSENSLIRATMKSALVFINPTTAKDGAYYPFFFETIQENISILSPNCVVSYNQAYFWPGINQFYVYNGIVQSLKNTTNSNFFFSNLNFEQRHKVWATVIPLYQEIWWFFPMRTSDECNHAVIYNMQENIWYDTPISRAAGTSSGVLPFPIWSDSQGRLDFNAPIPPGQPVPQTYGVWYHEYQLDEYFYNQINAIRSSFTTSIFSIAQQSPQEDAQMRSVRIEPDFIQKEEMSVRVNTHPFAGTNPVVSQPYPFTPETGKIDMREMGRLSSYTFESNTPGGFYQGGKPLLNWQKGDERP